MAVDVRMDGAVRVGEPRLVFDAARYALSQGPGMRNYDITPDGERFLVSAEAERDAPTIQVVVNCSKS